MSYRMKMFAFPYLVSGGLTAALLGIPDASVEERITLEIIGAVPMVRADDIRSKNPELLPVETTPKRDQFAERTPGQR